MKRHSCEVGIGIDHFAALEINGNEFRVGQTESVDVGGGGGGKVLGVGLITWTMMELCTPKSVHAVEQGIRSSTHVEESSETSRCGQEVQAV